MDQLAVRDGRIVAGPLLMGVVNATPDSFSDGGKNRDALVARVRAIAAEGAIVDIGGESTRPGAVPVDAAQEGARVLPLVRAAEGAVVSIDTTKASVASSALEAGARIVNDVSGGLYDPALLDVVARARAYVILGHLRGTPATMNSLANYGDVIAEVRDELAARIEAARAAGIATERIFIDPGIGFAKHTAHSLAVIARLDELRALGHPIVVGASRKRFLGELSGAALHEREEATAAAHAIAIWQGADIVRVHDVVRHAGAMRVAVALSRARSPITWP